MRVHVLGGFLGAGKTSLARALADELGRRGERVALITNDQGHALVDTSLCRAGSAQVQEIVGGCFCCRYDDLEEALLAAERDGATYAIAEAVGSCTDLIATVLAPLADRHPSRLQLAPLAVVVDPWRVHEVALGRVHEDVAYLFNKQIEEADVVLLSRADLDPPDVREAVEAIRPGTTILAVSGPLSQGLDAWLACKPGAPAKPLLIDYDRYAAAEALLGWANARVKISGSAPFQPGPIAQRFLEAMARYPVAHVKLTSLEPGGGRAAVVRQGDAPSVDFDDSAPSVREASWLVNARVAMDPEALVAALEAALASAAAPALVEWSELEAFRPARPTPTHRYAFRCGTSDDASCCAAFYDRSDVRALLGDSWHPGGVELTLAVGEKLGLGPGKRVLDVACGKGTSLAALRAKWGVEGTGMDAQLRPADAPGLELLRGDAHAIPFQDAGFDALICECALSTFGDQPTALREMRRVLRPGGRVAITDMAVEAEIPDALKEWVHTGTCLSRAMTSTAYARALEDAGLRVVDQWDASDGLREILRRIKRNLVGAAFAAASGNLGDGVKIDMKYARGVLREAEAAVDAGTIRYTALIAERVDAAVSSRADE